MSLYKTNGTESNLYRQVGVMGKDVYQWQEVCQVAFSTCFILCLCLSKNKCSWNKNKFAVGLIMGLVLQQKVRNIFFLDLFIFPFFHLLSIACIEQTQITSACQRRVVGKFECSTIEWSGGCCRWRRGPRWTGRPRTRSRWERRDESASGKRTTWHQEAVDHWGDTRNREELHFLFGDFKCCKYDSW